jgi:uncharacterized C2H2 Zn-finger protein
LRDKGFIYEFAKHIQESTKTNADWALTIAIVVLSTILGKKAKIKTEDGWLVANFYALMIAPSRIGRKTLPLNKGFEIIERVADLINDAFPDHNPQTDFILPTEGSMEGFTEFLNKHTKQGCIFRDEFTTLFKNMRVDYLRGEIEFLSKLYDGTTIKRYTKGSKLEYISGHVVNMLAATTANIFKIMTLAFFVQGLGNRLLFVFGDPEFIERDGDKFLRTPYQQYRNYGRDEYTERFVNEAHKLSEFCPDNIFVTKEASELLTEFYNEMQEEAVKRYKQDMTDIESSYRGELGTTALKLATLHCLSYNFDVITQGNTKLDDIGIRAISAKWAINIARKYLAHFHTIMDIWTLAIPEKPTPSTKHDVTAIMTYIKRKGAATISSLHKTFGWYKPRIKEILKSLIEMGDVFEITENEQPELYNELRKKLDTRKGRKTSIYYPKDENL